MAFTYPHQISQASFNVYYRVADGDGKKLSQIHVSDAEDHVDAIQEVMHSLHRNMESFFKPVLTVIKGGKK